VMAQTITVKQRSEFLMAQAITVKRRWEILMAQAHQDEGARWMSDGSSHHREAALGILLAQAISANEGSG